MIGKRIASRMVVVAAITTGALMLAACAGPPSPGSKTNAVQSLKIGISADVPNLKPSLDQGAAAMELDTIIHRGLLAYDAQGKVVPALAEKYKQLNPTTYQFDLRNGLKFSDGSPLTSENVKKSLEHLADPAVGAKIYSAMKELKTVETPNKQTVIVKLKTPNAALPEYLADPSAAILPDSAFANSGTSWVGAGPYVLKQTNKGVSFVFAKNPKYYDAGKVKLDKITVSIYADGAARTNALIAGDVDLIDFVPWENIARVKSTPGLTVDVTSGPFMYLQFNVTKGPFADVRVRQAVALAVNRKNVVSAAFSGQAKPIAGAPIDTSSPFYDKTLANGWATNVSKAKTLLAEAGYANGFKATLLTSSQYSFHQDTALSVQADLKKIGIDVTLDAPDWATRQQKALAGNYDIAIGGSAGVVNDPSFLANFVTGPAANNRSFGFDDPKLDQLLAEGLAAKPGQRKTIYDQVQKEILSSVPFVTLVGRSQAYGVSDKVKGFANIPGFLTFDSGYTLADTSISSK